MRKFYLMYLVGKITIIDSFLGQFCSLKEHEGYARLKTDLPLQSTAWLVFEKVDVLGRLISRYRGSSKVFGALPVWRSQLFVGIGSFVYAIYEHGVEWYC